MAQHKIKYVKGIKEYSDTNTVLLTNTRKRLI